jgi:hypothetical protein
MFASMKHLRARRLGVLIAAFAGLSIAIAACDDPTLSLPREGAPEELRFSYSAFFGPSQSVELRKDTLVLRRAGWSDGINPPAVDSVRVVPTAEEWRGFWDAVEETGVGRWRRRYVAENIADGLGWQLRLRVAGGRVESEGSNAYPDRSGREHEGEPTPEFLAFVDALGDLVGQPIR